MDVRKIGLIRYGGVFARKTLEILVDSFLVLLHDVNLLSGKNQVADNAGILKKIGTWTLNFRIIIVERSALL